MDLIDRSALPRALLLTHTTNDLRDAFRCYCVSSAYACGRSLTLLPYRFFFGAIAFAVLHSVTITT